MKLQKMLLQVAVAALIGTAAIVATTGGAAAYVVCNHDGDCWHTDARYSYPDRGYERHPDEWYFHHHFDRGRYRDYHEGRGYWRNGLWVTF